MSEQPPNNKNVTCSAGIAAGGNTSIGDNTGQIAIGKYISQEFDISHIAQHDPY